MIDDFLTWCEKDRNRSPATIRRYRIILDHLTTFGDPITLDLDTAQRWWESLYGKQPATRANYLAAARSFYKWATRFGHRDDDPTRRLDAPSVPIRAPRMIGKHDFHLLLGEYTADAPDLRRTFALGGYAGLRISECASLDWSSIDQELRRIYVTGKGNKQRPVALSALLLDYLLPDTGGNVITGGGEPYSAATLQRKINRLMERHKIDHTFHDFRKRAASIALSKGASMPAVRAMFGWSSMQTVAHYAVVGDSELDQIAQFLAE